MRFLLVFFLLSQTIAAQDFHKTTWQMEEAFLPMEMCQDSEGFNYLFINRGFSMVDSAYFVLAKYSADYDPIWSKAIGLNHSFQVGDVELVGDSCFLVVGSSNLSADSSSGNFLMKVSLQGDIEETLSYGQSGIYFNSPSLISVNGDRMLVSRSANNETATHFLQLDEAGNPTENFKLYAGGRPIRLMDIVEHEDGLLYSTGSVRHSEFSHLMPFIMCTDADQVLWFEAFDLTQSASGNSISVGPSGEILIGGYILESGAFPASSSALVLKTDGQGDVLLSKKVEKDEVSAEYVTDLIHREDYSLIWFYYDNYSSNSFSYVSNLDSSLNPSWTKSQSEVISYSSDKRIQDSAAIGLGFDLENYELFTEKIPFDTGEMCDVSDYEFSFVDIDIVEYTAQVEIEYFESPSIQIEVSSVDFEIENSEICSQPLKTEDSIEMLFQVYPNPFQNQVGLNIPVGISQLDIFSIDGTKIKSVNVVEGLLQIDLSAYRSGVYVFQLSGKSGFSSQRIIKL